MTEWTQQAVGELFDLPFADLLFRAQQVHRENFPANKMQLSNLLSIKTGACPEDCHYCSQSGHHSTEVEKEKLLPVELVRLKAQAAKEQGATRFCLGAAWRNPPKKSFPQVIEMIKAVKALGLESCVTLGMLDDEQTQALKEAGLDYYNHNLDTSPEHYQKIVTTRSYQDRIDTLKRVNDAGIHVCCGGILGMGETRTDRIELLRQLAQLPQIPQSIPINQLIPVPGTPLADAEPIDNFEFIRTIAVARIMFPTAMVRLSAGRSNMSDEMQALCFLAGANSLWIDDVLLTMKNPSLSHDKVLFETLGITPFTLEETTCQPA